MIIRPTQAQLATHIRDHVARQLYDNSGTSTPGIAAGIAQGIAIYSLSDPRDIRQVRYIGQTAAPVRRFYQHLNAAQLLLPDDVPWWIKAPKLRPLSSWIRTLYQDEYRLPTMVVFERVETRAAARTAERNWIHEHLAQRCALLNVEFEILQRQSGTE